MYGSEGPLDHAHMSRHGASGRLLPVPRSGTVPTRRGEPLHPPAASRQYPAAVGKLQWLLVAWAAVLGANAVPAFAPPATAILAVFRVTRALPLWPLTIGGAAAGALGRAILGTLSRHAAPRLRSRDRENAAALGAWLKRRPRLRPLLIFVYSAGPFPTNALFVTVGIGGLPLLSTSLIYFLARCLAGSLWVWTIGNAVETSSSPLSLLTDWPVLGASAAGVAGLVAVFAFPWARWLGYEEPPKAPRRR